MKNIAIIPARSGSKGLVDKNIKMFCNKPLVAWTIEAALQSNMFAEVMVSTDSEVYKEIALQYGAHVPFLRSSENSGDCADSWDVMREVISRYEEMGEKYDSICMLQPTSPLRTGEDIIKAYDILDKKKAQAVIAVCELKYPIRLCNKLGPNESMCDFLDLSSSVRRQNAEKYYRINGALYIQKVSDLKDHKTPYGPESYAYIMDEKVSIDIDDEFDFIIAENVYRVLSEEK